MRLPLLPALLLAAAAQAQEPRRPRLPADADTNDAVAYFRFGEERVERLPEQALAAFYWTYRLEPSSPQALYAQYVARLLRDKQRLVRHVERDPRALSQPQLLAIDSLLLRANMQDPFFHRGMEELLLLAYAQNAPRNEEWFGRSEDYGSAGIVRRMEQHFEQSDPYSRGRLYYSHNELRNALQYYAIALRNQDVAWLHAERGRAWAELRQLDSAKASFERAILLSRQPGQVMAQHPHESRVMWNYALGRIQENRSDLAAARAAYEESLRENPGFSPAALRLGLLAVGTRDSSTALFRLAQATLPPATPFWILTAAASGMSRIGQQDSVIALLRRATEAEPFASGGWLLYAQTLASAGRNADAIPAYERYIALAPRNDIARAAAITRLQQLRP